MTDRFASIKSFFRGTSHVLSTPSGDARGHMSVYPPKALTRERNA